MCLGYLEKIHVPFLLVIHEAPKKINKQNLVYPVEEQQMQIKTRKKYFPLFSAGIIWNTRAL